MNDFQIEVRPLTYQEIDNFLQFMDGPAFETNPQWGECYCQFYLNSAEDQTDQPGMGPINRQKACDRVANGTMHGYIAYVDGKPIGWVAANKANNFKLLPPTDDDVARVLCFIVARDYQGRGVATALLEHAVSDLKEQGFRLIEAAPLASDEFQSWGYRGKLSTFKKAGFVEVAPLDDKHVLVQRQLTD
ncbi:MAG: hypothetical protein RLZZ400_484 [Actinomycetota bacterium]